MKTIEDIGIPRYNGLILPGYDTKNPVTPYSPRWMIVWDSTGWTKPVRRIVVMFDGKFLDTDGNYWDFGSDIPREYNTPELAEYWRIHGGKMKFRSAWTPPAKDYLTVAGLYFHGKIEEAFGHDLVDIAATDAETFRLLVNETKDGIDGMKVEVDGYPGEAVLFAWKSNIGVPTVANQPFETLHFRGFIVDPKDKKAIEFARQCYSEKRKSL